MNKEKGEEEEEVWEKGKQQNDSFLSACSYTQMQRRASSPREQSQLVIKRVGVAVVFSTLIRSFYSVLHINLSPYTNTNTHTHTIPVL